jgi:hypothetical protein
MNDRDHVAIFHVQFLGGVVDARWTNFTQLRSSVLSWTPLKMGQKKNDCGLTWDSRKEQKQAPGNTK